MIEALALSTDQDGLIVTWADGEISHLSAPFLRCEARDAWTRRELIDKGKVDAPPDLTIAGFQHVGAAAINILFSDGHDKAIYPFPYLRELSERFDN